VGDNYVFVSLFYVSFVGGKKNKKAKKQKTKNKKQKKKERKQKRKKKCGQKI
jgi:hypothetical protein